MDASTVLSLSYSFNPEVGSIVTYTFAPFTTSPSDCGIFSYSIMSESSPITIYPSAICETNPCQSIDISVEVPQTLTFNIEVTANGGATDSTT